MVIQKVDVIIIGAGLSGLRAATDLHEAGFTYLVLEAMDRVGGKTLSVPTQNDNSAPVELGAAWINDTTQSEMYALAQKFDFELIRQRDEGDSLFQGRDGEILKFPHGVGVPLPEEHRAEMHNLMGTLEGFVKKVDLENPHLSTDAAKLDAMNGLEFAMGEFNGGHLDAQLITFIVNSLLGIDPEEISALNLIDYIKSSTGMKAVMNDGQDGGHYLRIAQGSQSFSERLAANLPEGSIKTSTPVTKICQSDTGASVHTADGRHFECSRVIITVPSPLYSSISFEPDLPMAKKALGESTTLGYYAKTIYVFDSPWWHEAGLSGSLNSCLGPITFTRDTCVASANQYSITCFHVGGTGRAWSQLTDKDRRDAVWKHFTELYSAAVRDIPQPVKVTEKEWTKDIWVRGAPSPVVPKGLMMSEAARSIREPAGRLHFAGTGTSLMWRGYMEGAIRSGARAVAEVIAALN